jgi:hypothetical protein
MPLSGIHDFKDLTAGFPTKTISGMTFCGTLNAGGFGGSDFPAAKDFADFRLFEPDA